MSNPINGDFYAAYDNLMRAVEPVANRVIPPSPQQSTTLTPAEVEAIKRWGNALLNELRQSKRSDEP